MFIENPHKKESYSFRVKPDLLENIKLYAKATNQTVPEILNDMIEDKVNGLLLTNDYLPTQEYGNIVISIPTLEELHTENLDLVKTKNSSNILQVNQIPNNLDEWTETDGYKSNQRNTKHEGIEFLLLPNLILQAGYHIVDIDGMLNYCLIPVYFRVTNDNKVIVSNLHMDTALGLIRQSKNIELLELAQSYEIMVKETINKYTETVHNAVYNEQDLKYYSKGFQYSDYEELLKDQWSKLLVDLDENIKPKINTGVITYLDGTIRELEEDTDSTKLVSDNNFILYEEISKLREENEKLKAENEAINNTVLEVQKELTDIDNYLQSLKEDINEKERLWDNLKTEDKKETSNINK